MAQRTTDDGRDVPGRTAPPNGIPDRERERDRRAAESPPGSRERSESDATGWSPERDEEPSAREGRYHRAAQLRLAQPRTEVGAPPPQDDTGQDLGIRHRLFRRDRPFERAARTSADHGPYGRDDRLDDESSGRGLGARQGDQDLNHSLEASHTPRDYRPWDRTGYGGRDAPPMRPPPEEQGERELRGPGGPEQRRREERTWEEDRPERRERTSEGYSGLVGMGRQPAEQGRRGRWKREPLNARELMTRHVKSARLDSSLRDVARIMKDEDCGIVPVVDERGRLRGLLTDRDMVIRTLAEGRPPDTMHARDVMTEDVEAVTPDEDIHSIIALMGHRQVRRVPVVERDDRLVGIISMADIATRADYDEELQEALDRISARRSFWSRLY